VLIIGSVALLFLSVHNATIYWALETPLAALLSAWIHSALLSTAAFCLLLFFAVPEATKSNSSHQHGEQSKENGLECSSNSSKATSQPPQPPTIEQKS
jgi:hypothetical protein